MLDIAETSGWFVYLILHHRITNLLNQTAEFTRILSIIEESFGLPLLLQWHQFSTDIFQFPIRPCQLDFTVRPAERVLTVPTSFSSLLPSNRS